jgi:hypothetical protein
MLWPDTPVLARGTGAITTSELYQTSYGVDFPHRLF